MLGKRPDGTHDLLTLFERVDLADDLEVKRSGPAGSLEFSCDAPGVPSDGTNLAVRAAQAYREASGWKEGLRIRLRKRIPAGGGLGGGSSDAAAVLRAMQALSGSALPPERLMECARGLGADVAFFAVDVPWALGRQRGDQIEPVTMEVTLWHLLVTPDFPVPTKKIYEAYVLTPPGPDVTLQLLALKQGQLDRARELLFNTLEPTVEALYPAIRVVKETIASVGGLARPCVSGSGSTVFAVCSSEQEARDAADRVSRHQPNWTVKVARTI